MTTLSAQLNSRLKSWISVFRVTDSIVAQAPAIIGIVFAISYFDFQVGLRILACIIASFFLMAHIFCINDWADHLVDQNDPKKNDSNFLSKNLSRAEVLLIAIVLGVLALAAFFMLSIQLFYLAAIGILFSFIYSFPIPKFQAKRTPFLSSLLHLAGSSITFLLGYGLLSSIDSKGLAIGFYFGLIFTAGHLMQEVQDWEGDLKNNITTHAVYFGPKVTFLASNILFTISYVYFVALVWIEFIPSILLAILLSYPIHLILAYTAFKEGLDFYTMRRFRDRYRILYGLILVFIISSVLFFK